VIDQLALGVYFIDQYNFPELCDRAQNGDALSRQLMLAIMGFVEQAPNPICSICHEHLPGPDVPSMTIVVLRTDRATLTTWICEECSVRDDLDDHVKKIIREWPEIPKNSIVEILKKGTMH
jgi:hypothetical protein